MTEFFDRLKGGLEEDSFRRHKEKLIIDNTLADRSLPLDLANIVRRNYSGE